MIQYVICVEKNTSPRLSCFFPHVNNSTLPKPNNLQRLQFPHHKHPIKKTFQKPLNLYQYLHYSSAHQDQVYKSIIRGKCIRYICTNSTKETYCAMLFLFKQRLLKRGYPPVFIDKVLHTVNYKSRQRYLLRHQKHQPTCIPPLYKCIPPPQYKLLKQIVFQNYAQLHFISPRFIAQRHPTLQKPISQSQNQAHR